MEAAIVLPVFLAFIFAIVEFGHTQLVNNMLNTAVRSAARLGAVEGVSSSQVETEVLDILGSAFPTSTVEVFVKDASVFDGGGSPPESGSGIESLSNLELSDAEPRQLFVVRAKVAYNDIALLPHSLMDGVVLQSQSFMRHE